MKIGLICDLHMSYGESSAQHAFFMRAAERFKKDGVWDIVSIGDITSFGEEDVLSEYIGALSGFRHRLLLGNSDVRTPGTAERILKRAKSFDEVIGGMRIVGINTPYAKIEDGDRGMLKTLSDGDFLIMHHSVQGLEAESREFLTSLCEKIAFTVIHAHSHKIQDYMIGRAHIVGIRALDPDKSIGGWPCVTYLDTESGKLEEVLFDISKNTTDDLSKYFGISCVDNHRDVKYAAENRVFGVELRCNGKGWEPDMTLLPVIENWRECGGGYLSVHMPNLRWRDGEMSGVETWYNAVGYAKAVGAQGLTMHPPRVRKCDMKGKVYDEFLKLYVYAVESVGADVKIGIENLHMERGEDAMSDECCFGYTPAEVSAWIDAVNEAIQKPGRVGHTLDVGHARNNGSVSQKYPISRWYEIMGNKTVAYHIHQVVPGENGMINHAAIEKWFGPIISYASFFYCWEKGIINRVPVFLEVKGSESFDKSIKAFREIFM